MVAGQRVMVLPSTWVAGRFGVGNWITVSGLRQPDGTIVASRLDRARVGALAVRGKVMREHDITRIGNLVLHGPAAAAAKPGTFVQVVGRYVDGAAEVTSIDLDLLSEDPVRLSGTLGPSGGRAGIRPCRVRDGVAEQRPAIRGWAGGAGKRQRLSQCHRLADADGGWLVRRNPVALHQLSRPAPGGPVRAGRTWSGHTGVTAVFAPRAGNGRPAGECDRYGTGSRHATCRPTTRPGSSSPRRRATCPPPTPCRPRASHPAMGHSLLTSDPVCRPARFPLSGSPPTNTHKE